MRQVTLKVLLNRKNSKNKMGLYSVYIRLTQNRKSVYVRVPLPVKIFESDWSGKENAWIKSSRNNAFELNQLISKQLSKFNKIILDYYLKERPLTLDVLLERESKNEFSKTFNEYFKNYIDSRPEKLDDDTWKKYIGCLNHLNSFNPRILFADINGQLIRSFKKYLENPKGLNLQGATIKSYFDKLKKVIKAAKRDDYINDLQIEYLFEDIKISVQKSKRIFLEPEEINEIKKLEFSDEEKFLERDRDIFLLLVYTGYYYEAIKFLEKEHLITSPSGNLFICGSRFIKNQNPTKIPIYKFPHAVDLLNKYKNEDSDAAYFKRDIFISNQKFNENLKIIAKRARIQKNVTNKVARHTSAQIWIRIGLSPQYVGKFLGHTKTETTGIYYEVDVRDIEQNVQNINFKELAI